MRLVDAGCKSGDGRGRRRSAAPGGITNRDALKIAGATRLPRYRAWWSMLASARRPSHAAQALELGYDAVLLNTAIAKSRRPPSRWRNAFSSRASRPAAPLMKRALMEARDFRLPFNPCRRDTVLACPYPDRHAYPDRFYPVVDSVAWVGGGLALLGVGTIQLRAKDLKRFPRRCRSSAMRSR